MATTIQNPPPRKSNRGPEGEPLESRQMSFFEHLEELRQRLLRAILGLLIATAICFYFSDYIYAWLAQPLTDTLRSLGMSDKLVYTNPIDPFNLYIKLSLVAGIFLSSPWILYQFWLFISPGLYRHEKRYVWPFVFLTSSLFIGGGLFAHELALPPALRFLVEFGGQFTPFITIDQYWKLVTTILIGVGLAFQLPVIVLLLSLFGIVTPRFLLRHSRYGILVTAIIAAGLAPTPDLATVFILWIPMVGLYFLSVFLSWLVYLKKKRAARHAE